MPALKIRVEVGAVTAADSSACRGWDCDTPPPRRRRHKEMLKSQPLVPGNVSLSGNTAFVVVIKV